MTDQEIRAEALKAATLTLLLMDPVKREQVLNRGGKDIQENTIAASHVYSLLKKILPITAQSV